MSFADIFKTVLNMSITGAYIAAAIIVLRPALKKLPKKYSYALWLILGIRLLCPFSLSSAVSIFNLIKPETTENQMMYIPHDLEYSPEPQVTVSLPPVNNAVNEAIGESLAPVPDNSANPLQIVLGVCSVIWLAGVAVMVLYTVVSYLLVRKKVKPAALLQDNIYICKNIDSPFVYGIFKPRVYLPHNVPADETEFILAHENAHIRRGDHIIKLIAMLALCIHWFNPLAWVSYSLMIRDMELSCDEMAVKSFDRDVRKAYAETLLNMSVRQNKIVGILAFGESNIKTRIKTVLTAKKPKVIVSVIAVLAVAVAAVCMLTNAVEKEPELTPAEKSVTEHLEEMKNYEYVLSVEIISVKENAEGTAEARKFFKNNPQYEGVILSPFNYNNFVVVDAEYDVDYDETRMPNIEGRLKVPFTVEKFGDGYYLGRLDQFYDIYLEPPKISDFSSFVVSGEMAHRCDEDEMAEFAEAFDRIELMPAPDRTGNEIFSIEMYLSDEQGVEPYSLKFGSNAGSDSGGYVLYSTPYSRGRVFGISNEDFKLLQALWQEISVKAFTGTVILAGGGEYYTVSVDEDISFPSGEISVHSKYPFKEGDRVKVFYYGAVMETYPAMVRQETVVKIGSGELSPHQKEIADRLKNMDRGEEVADDVIDEVVDNEAIDSSVPDNTVPDDNGAGTEQPYDPQDAGYTACETELRIGELDEYGGVNFTENTTGKYLIVRFELSGEWKFNGFSTAEYNGLKMFEIGAVWLADGGYYVPEIKDGKYINDMGREVTVIEQKYGTDGLYEYMSHESVPDYYSDTGYYEFYKYIVKRGDYYIVAHFVETEYFDEAACEHFLKTLSAEYTEKTE